MVSAAVWELLALAAVWELLIHTHKKLQKGGLLPGHGQLASHMGGG
jgi:hypothetical protein